LLDQVGEAVHAAAKIDRLTSEQNPQARSRWYTENHGARRKCASTCRNAALSTAPQIRTRAPPISTSMVPPHPGCETAGLEGSGADAGAGVSATIRSGTKLFAAAALCSR
jgi:hypothetical protein